MGKTNMKTIHNNLIFITIMCSLLFIVKSLKSEKISSTRHGSSNACIWIFSEINYGGDHMEICDTGSVRGRSEWKTMTGAMAKFKKNINSVKLGSSVRIIIFYPEENLKGRSKMVTKDKAILGKDVQSIRLYVSKTHRNNFKHDHDTIRGNQKKYVKTAEGNAHPGKICITIFDKYNYEGSYAEICGPEDHTVKSMSYLTDNLSKFSQKIKSVRLGSKIEYLKLYQKYRKEGNLTKLLKDTPKIDKIRRSLRFAYPYPEQHRRMPGYGYH